MTEPKIVCPECGASEGIYARIDVRWDGESWEFLPREEALDCTHCDASFEPPDGMEPGDIIEAMRGVVDMAGAGNTDADDLETIAGAVMEAIANGQPMPGLTIEEPGDEPCPVNRRPKSTCPDGCTHGA